MQQDAKSSSLLWFKRLLGRC